MWDDTRRGLGRPVAHYLVLVVSGLALLVAEPVATQVAAAARLPPHLKALPQPSIPQAPSKKRSTTLQRYRAPAQVHKDTRSAEPVALRLTPDAAHPWPVPKDPPDPCALFPSQRKRENSIYFRIF